MNKGNVMWMANENLFSDDPKEDLEERKLFVENLGWLLSQTREGIGGCQLERPEQGGELVHVIYENGYELCVNVHLDSYTAIIRDVAEAIKL